MENITSAIPYPELRNYQVLYSFWAFPEFFLLFVNFRTFSIVSVGWMMIMMMYFSTGTLKSMMTVGLPCGTHHIRAPLIPRYWLRFYEVNVIIGLSLLTTEIDVGEASMAASEKRRFKGCFPSIGSLFKRSQKRVGMMEKCLSFKAPKREVKLRNSFERGLDVDEKISEWHLPDEWNTDFQNEEIKKWASLSLIHNLKLWLAIEHRHYIPIIANIYWHNHALLFLAFSRCHDWWYSGNRRHSNLLHNFDCLITVYITSTVTLKWRKRPQKNILLWSQRWYWAHVLLWAQLLQQIMMIHIPYQTFQFWTPVHLSLPCRINVWTPLLV